MMDLRDAIKALKHGAVIYRIGWETDHDFPYIWADLSGNLVMQRREQTRSISSFSVSDIFADDWQTLPHADAARRQMTKS